MDWLSDLSGWAIAGGVAVVTAAIAAIAERRRNNRKNIEKVGFMPWPFVMLMSLLFAAISIGLAFKGY
ncbi:hypothetical protein GCM10009096_11900 [Parasphingorhabdus litoris]|uniref:Uncharacterized protein n=1 Tax=Parasphingorhabdus litoris TaxID=394733 RepID=A0ABN1ABK2_9SPHN|nr:hypothetical protein [Parasphingorhabdus litoris]